VDEKFTEEESAAFDLEMVINSTKTSAQVYDNLAQDNLGYDIDLSCEELGFPLVSPSNSLKIIRLG